MSPATRPRWQVRAPRHCRPADPALSQIGLTEINSMFRSRRIWNRPWIFAWSGTGPTRWLRPSVQRTTSNSPTAAIKVGTQSAAHNDLVLFDGQPNSSLSSGDFLIPGRVPADTLSRRWFGGMYPSKPWFEHLESIACAPLRPGAFATDTTGRWSPPHGLWVRSLPLRWAAPQDQHPVEQPQISRALDPAKYGVNPAVTGGAAASPWLPCTSNHPRRVTLFDWTGETMKPFPSPAVN